MIAQPAAEITLRHGDHAVTLRASLRAAIALEQQDGGMSGVLTRISDQHLSTLTATIRASATDRRDADRLLTDASNHPLRPFLDVAQAACLALIAAILPTAEAAKSRTTSTTPSHEPAKPWRDHFADLYRFGTGWLGWTPESVWNASIAELTEAFAAHTERLIAMNGGARDDKNPTGPNDEQRQANIAAGLDPDFDRAGLQALKAKLS